MGSMPIFEDDICALDLLMREEDLVKVEHSCQMLGWIVQIEPAYLFGVLVYRRNPDLRTPSTVVENNAQSWAWGSFPRNCYNRTTAGIVLALWVLLEGF